MVNSLTVYADQQATQSVGSAGFYGVYQPENAGAENNKGHPTLEVGEPKSKISGNNSGITSGNSGNESVSAAAVIPRAGDQNYAGLQSIGLVFLFGGLAISWFKKRKEAEF